MGISLRGRLALWYVLTVPALLLGLALTAQQIIVVGLRSELDNILETRAQAVISAVGSTPGNRREDVTGAIEHFAEQDMSSIPLLLRVTDPTGKVQATFGQLPNPVLWQLDQLLTTPGIQKGRFDTVGTLRVYTVALGEPSSGIFAVVQTGDSLAHVTAAQDRLWKYAILEGIAGSVLILTVGMVILHRGFRPLDRILKRVHEIESSNLQAGLPEERRPPELQKLARSLNAMWQRLHQAFKARETFIASVSHDLRTPLTALQGQIDVLLMQPSMDPEIKATLGRMAKEVRRLVRMTNNLLLKSELEYSPAFANEKVGLRELLDEVYGEVWTLAEDLDLSIQADGEALVGGDRDLLKQMVLNLVENAIKFTPKGGEVQLTLKQADGKVIFQVSDSGIGIPAKDLPYVMEPFHKAVPSRGAAGGGAGLGLAIVKRVVELHNGQVEIDSAEGAGTVVKVWLPISQDSNQENGRLVRVS